MTNEEIYKKANEDLKPQEKVYNSIYVGTLLLFIIGLIAMIVPIELYDAQWAKWLLVLFLAIGFMVYMYAILKYTETYQKMRRNYQYNLVRKDERKRIEDK